MCSGRLPDPPEIMAVIKQQKQNALGLTNGPDPEAGLTSFCASMNSLLSRPGLRTEYIHFSAITIAAAHIWTGAQRSPRFRGHADVRERLKALYQRCLRSLQPLLADMGARQISIVLWSSATLSFNPDDVVPGMVHALTSRFLQFIGVKQEKQRPNAQHVANVLWAFATMGHPAATTQVVGALCSHFEGRTLHQDAQQRPKAQECSNVLWALAKLGHVPSHDVVAAVFDHLVALCQNPGLQPGLQEISNCLLACAELRLAQSLTGVKALLKHLLKLHISSVDYQHYCNTAWSLAVMQCLDLNTFGALLDKLTTKHKLVEQFGPQSTAPQMTAANTRQLYQALAWLRPPTDSKQMKAWSSLRSRLLTVAPEPAVRKLSIPGQDVMWAALAIQEVPYEAQVQRGVYQADALLILMVERPGDHLINSSRYYFAAQGYVAKSQLLLSCIEGLHAHQYHGLSV